MAKKHPKLLDWLGELDQSTRDYIDEFYGLDKRSLNWKPQPGIWSIGQVIDHVITLNETYYPKFKALKEGRLKLPFHARIGFIPRFFGKLLYNSVSEDRSTKMKTVAPFFPSESDIPGDILARYQEHKEELKRFLEAHQEYISPKTIITSPANDFLVYSTELAVEAIVVHEKRHLQQAKEVKMLLE